MMRTLSTITVALTFVAACFELWLAPARASQGPGVAPGTAGSTLQLAVAIAIYGASALLIATGLIGAARRKKG